MDYKIICLEKAAPPLGGAAKLGGSGLNKETILMNINTFKKLCLKANTKRTAIGNALRNKIIYKGFLWRYSGISKEDQMTDQPVIRITCNNGEKKHYPNISSAAKDAKISSTGLRNRILTNVHTNEYHWIFDKNATHYN